MSTQERSVSQSLQNTFSPTMLFTRGAAIFLICTTILNISFTVFNIVTPISLHLLWLVTTFATFGFGLSLIALAVTTHTGIGKFGFFAAFVLLIVNISINTQLIKADLYPFIANFPLYVDLHFILIPTNTLMNIFAIISFLILPILIGISLIISGIGVRQATISGLWKNTPLLLGVWLILSVLLALPILATLSRSLMEVSLGNFLLDLPKLILMIFLGIGLWQAKTA